MDRGESDEVERARALTVQAIRLCEQAGETVAAAHLQLGLDLMGSKRGNRLRDERSPWPDPSRGDRAPED